MQDILDTIFVINLTISSLSASLPSSLEKKGGL